MPSYISKSKIKEKNMEDFGYYVFALVVLVVGFLVVKKVATCMIKAVVGFIVLAVLAGIYWLYIA